MGNLSVHEVDGAVGDLGERLVVRDDDEGLPEFVAQAEEEVVQLLPGGDRRIRQMEELGALRAYKGHWEPVGHDLVVTPSFQNGLLVRQCYVLSLRWFSTKRKG